MAQQATLSAAGPSADGGSAAAGSAGAAVDGMAIEQFAWIQAALDEGFTLADVLEKEGVGADAWERARVQHVPAIATDGAVYARYQQALEEAQDRFRRVVSPLFDDLSAWVAMLRLSEERPLADVCVEFGLNPNDFSRLERHWRKRFDADEPLAKEARALRRDSEPPRPPPAVEVHEAELVASPYALSSASSAQAPDAEVPSSATPAPIPEPSIEPEDLDRVAALEAYMAAGVTFGVLQSRFDVANVTDAEARIASTRAAVAGDRDLARHYRQRVAHYERLASARLASGPVLIAPGPATNSPVGPTPAASPVASVVEMTADVDVIRLDIAPLPFVEGPAIAPAPVEFEPHDEAGQTVYAGLSALKPPAHPSSDETAALDNDLVALFADKGGLPFAGESGPPPAAVPATLPASAPTTDERAAEQPGAIDGMTRPLDPKAFAEAVLPFVRELDDPQKQLLFADVQRYASYCVELAEDGAVIERVRQRYSVETLQQHEALSTAWSERLATDGALRAQFEQAVETYREWRKSESQRGGS